MEQEGESWLKNWGRYAVGLIIIVVLFLAVGVFLGGLVWLSGKVLPWLETASRITFDVCVFVLLPLCIFRKTRPWAGVAFVYASLLFGAMLFAFSCLFVFSVWGFVGLIIGLIIAGVGVVPVALLAALLHAQWAVLLDLLFGIVLTFGTRWLGRRLTVIHSRDELA